MGIGGIGMSALARYFHTQDYIVSGYDKTPSPLTYKLNDEGIIVSFEDDVVNLPSVYIDQKDKVLVVYTPAIPTDNILFNYFKNEGYTLAKRAEILGLVTKQTINLSVAGTHGKTTTSSIVAAILQHSNVQFTAFLGGISANLKSNYYYQEGNGKRHISVTEADEFDRSFLHLNPDFAIVTSTDADHLDIYGNKEELEASYTQFSNLVKESKNRFYAKGNAHHIEGVSYSAHDCTADYYAVTLKKSGAGTHFNIHNNLGEPFLKNLYLNIPGSHNLENAVGAALMTLKSGVSFESVKDGLANFKGIKRRFEYVFTGENVIYIDDYAHHPSELNAIISSVKRLYPDKKISVIFQPHLFSRTQHFMVDFAKELEQVDELFILPIYAARELPLEGVTSEALLELISSENARCIRKEDALNIVKNCKIEILLTLGAGDIDRLVQPLKEYFYGQV